MLGPKICQPELANANDTWLDEPTVAFESMSHETVKNTKASVKKWLKSLILCLMLNES